MQTQFWSVYTGREDKGQVLPPSTWTIHGLWPGKFLNLDMLRNLELKANLLGRFLRWFEHPPMTGHNDWYQCN